MHIPVDMTGQVRGDGQGAPRVGGRSAEHSTGRDIFLEFAKPIDTSTPARWTYGGIKKRELLLMDFGILNEVRTLVLEASAVPDVARKHWPFLSMALFHPGCAM